MSTNPSIIGTAAGVIRRVIIVVLASLALLAGSLALHSVTGATDMAHAVASVGNVVHQAEHAAAPTSEPADFQAQGGVEPLQACDADCGRDCIIGSLACVLLLILTVLPGLPRGPQQGLRAPDMTGEARTWASVLNLPALTPTLLSLSISRT